MFICNVLFYISIYFYVRGAVEIPSEEQLKTYVDALKRVSEFYEQHTEQVNIHSLFALSIANVNFKIVFDNYPDIKRAIKKEMRLIFDINQNCIDTYMLETNNTMPKQYRAITTLFNNITPSTHHLHEFKFTTRYYGIEYKLKYILYNAQVYKKEIKELKKILPNKRLSNICLAAIAEHPTNTKNVLLGCPIIRECNMALTNGTDFGYALSHKILWMALSRYGRGCIILSPSEDRRLTEYLCSKAYSEILFLLYYQFEFGKVMFDFMCTCSLLGHLEFLQTEWLNKSLDLQTSSGCFKASGLGNDTDAGKDPISKCDHHTTSMSICFLSVTVRYLLQNFKYYPF